MGGAWTGTFKKYYIIAVSTSCPRAFGWYRWYLSVIIRINTELKQIRVVHLLLLSFFWAFHGLGQRAQYCLMCGSGFP